MIASQERHLPPWVLTLQEGGDLNAFADLPPALAPADLDSAAQAGVQAAESARTLGDLGLSGVLGPVVDVGLERIAPARGAPTIPPRSPPSPTR